MKCFRQFVLIPALVIFYNIAWCQQHKPEFEIYGFIHTDIGYNFNSIDPDWFDVMRPSKLPSYKGQYGPAGNVYFSLRQTRLGFKSTTQTKLGTLKTQFDFDLFGFGKDIGQTTFHLINAYAQLGKIGVGQTASVFMDQDVFPVTLEYWGPNSRVFYFNIQLRYIPIETTRNRLMFAIERPGGTADGGDFTTSNEIKNVSPVLNFPNFTGHYRHSTGFGYLQAGFVTKPMKWIEVPDTSLNSLSGSSFGWGVDLSTTARLSKKLVWKIQGVFGQGIENYIADVTPDIGLSTKNPTPSTAIKGEALPVYGLFSFFEMNWTNELRSSLGYSIEEIKNTNLQTPESFHRGHYFLANLRYHPSSRIMIGIEYQYGKRKAMGGFSSEGNKIHLACRYSFSGNWGDD